MEAEKIHKLLHNFKIVFKHYGLEAQLGQLSEECNELATAAHHYQRAIKKQKTLNVSTLLHGNMYEMQTRKELISEVADVLNVVEQITRELDIVEEVQQVRYEKMERQVKRIQEETDKDNVSAIVNAGLMMANDYGNLVSRLEGFVRTTKFVHPHSAEALLRDAIEKSRYRISTWLKVLDSNKEKML